MEKSKPDEYLPTYKSPTLARARIAHTYKPEPRAKRPRYPIGDAKKVPIQIRTKYLDIIIDEFLHTKHSEAEAFKGALEEEKAIAQRAANKNIYANLVACLKKRLREKAGVSTASKVDSGKPGVSHDEILTGKVVGTFSIEKRKRLCTNPAELSVQELYDRLKRYILPKEELLDYGYPCQNPDNPTAALIPLKSSSSLKQQSSDEKTNEYICDRCKIPYKVDGNRIPINLTRCIYHPGHLWKDGKKNSAERKYSCCKGDQAAGGCSSSEYHVNKGEGERENLLGFQMTRDKPEKDPNNHGIYALDCEMSYTTVGLELTRVTVVDHKFDVIYEKLVKPKNFVLDYNSKYSGINEGDLDYVDTTLEDVQEDLLNIFSSKSILVGHSLDSDMKALKLIHSLFIDTAQLFPHKKGLPYKRALKTLMQEYLQIIIQEDSGHDSKEDASASLKLVFWKLKTDVPLKYPSTHHTNSSVQIDKSTTKTVLQ